jgi:hypothetical protein
MTAPELWWFALGSCMRADRLDRRLVVRKCWSRLRPAGRFLAEAPRGTAASLQNLFPRGGGAMTDQANRRSAAICRHRVLGRLQRPERTRLGKRARAKVLAGGAEDEL